MFSRENIRIENARLYPSEVVDRLYAALRNGSALYADESRPNFYDLNTGGRTYFIHISPANGGVTLIATWAQKHTSDNSKSDGQTAWWRRITEHLLAAWRTLSPTVHSSHRRLENVYAAFMPHLASGIYHSKHGRRD